MCSLLEVGGEPGLGSRAFNRRNSDMSVKLPSLPPRSFEGEVESRQGVPAMNSGRATDKAIKDVNAASLSTKSIECKASAPSDSGIKKFRAGRWRKGTRKPRTLDG